MPTLDSTSSLIAPTTARPRPWYRRRDIMILAGVTLNLWIITLLWQAIDFDAIVIGSLHTEADAWIFGLVLGPFYLAIKGLASIWGVLLGIPTCLLAGHLLAHRLRPTWRWPIVGAATAMVFITIPLALNHQEERRLASLYQKTDLSGAMGIAGRSVELPRKTPIPSGWRLPPECRDECLDLLTFGP